MNNVGIIVRFCKIYSHLMKIDHTLCKIYNNVYNIDSIVFIALQTINITMNLHLTRTFTQYAIIPTLSKPAPHLYLTHRRI